MFLIVHTFNHPLQPLQMMADAPDIAFDLKGKPFFYSLMLAQADSKTEAEVGNPA